MAISGLTSNTALPPALLAASEQPVLVAGEVVAARVVGQAPNGASQIAIGKLLVSLVLPDHPPTGTVLLLQVAGNEAGQRFTVLAEVAPEAAAHTALVPPNARLRLQALGLMPAQVFSASIVGRGANGLTRLAVGDSLIDMLLPRLFAAGETIKLQMPRDWSNLSLLRLVGGAEPAPMRESGRTIPLNPPAQAVLARLGFTQGATIEARVVGRNLVTIGEEMLELPLPEQFPSGATLSLKWPAEGGDRLLLLATSPPASGRALTLSPASLPVLHGLALKPGQRLEAEVVGRLPTGETEIAIAGHKLTVTLPVARPVGGRLALIVAGNAEQPQLLLAPEASPPSDIVALRQSALANQGSLGTVLAGLSRLENAPAQVAEGAAPLLKAPLPVDGDILAANLKQAIRNSGTFLEAQGNPAATDIKAALMGLRGALAAWLGMEAAAASGARRPSPPTRGLPRSHSVPLPQGDAADPATLLADTDAALNRLRLMQLASLPDPSAPQAQKAPLFTAEIPLQLGSELSLAQFQVVRDGGGQSAPEAPGERGWQMRFSINYAVTGEVGAQITLRGRRVSVSLWAERQTTAQVLETMLPDLRPGLMARGIEAVALTCRLGRPSEALAVPSGQYVDAVK